MWYNLKVECKQKGEWGIPLTFIIVIRQYNQGTILPIAENL